jgi:hypothetical protein
MPGSSTKGLRAARRGTKNGAHHPTARTNLLRACRYEKRLAVSSSESSTRGGAGGTRDPRPVAAAGPKGLSSPKGIGSYRRPPGSTAIGANSRRFLVRNAGLGPKRPAMRIATLAVLPPFLRAARSALRVPSWTNPGHGAMPGFLHEGPSAYTKVHEGRRLPPTRAGRPAPGGLHGHAVPVGPNSFGRRRDPGQRRPAGCNPP